MTMERDKRSRIGQLGHALTASGMLAFMINAATIACAGDSIRPIEPTRASFEKKLQDGAPTAPLVLHVVSPPATDIAIDQFVHDHYAWLDTTAHSIHRLLVLMAGTGQFPAQFLFVQREAARLGYHVIGLEYVNSGGIAKLCPPTSDPARCYEDVRLEIIDGVDRSPLVSVNAANSIDNRLDKVLAYLATQYPGEGWSQFRDSNGAKWPLIAVAGLSVGGGEAAMIAKIRVVDRVLMFSAVPDSIGRASVHGLVAPIARQRTGTSVSLTIETDFFCRFWPDGTRSAFLRSDPPCSSTQASHRMNFRICSSPLARRSADSSA